MCIQPNTEEGNDGAEAGGERGEEEGGVRERGEGREERGEAVVLCSVVG